MRDLDRRVAVITGAASGIGLGMVRVFTAAGFQVAMCDIRNAELDAVFGRVDILANNAGVLLRGRTVEDVPLADWKWIVGVNLYGPINGIEFFLPRIRRHGQGGHIVNTASISGFLVAPGRLTAPYQATKFTLVALSEALLSDLAETGIGVSVLAPAGVKTSIYQSGEARPARFEGHSPAFPTPDTISEGVEPDDIARRVLAAIHSSAFCIFTHEDMRPWMEARHRRMMQAYDKSVPPAAHALSSSGGVG
ncbi:MULTISPECIES: SDR family NAD(P)-dependent oxidoreductase [unclassified Chelatococcus]|uniref:SDR family oxidoreductase n=1 Tax=unclassified Chelatococcus TaxID=2638111 RepID=UPI00224BD70D|nr:MULTISPECIES: SDR family NAD(P)-dependent oxidoreductase [unclassified Chelatococcus]CAH1657467.1 putative C alpha-dehydrogenase [Hyphomicrobiales bacterium]CAH1689149.1 putative C alpha-dehydrogenase [Hyphomicrobiales bacterium]